MLKRASKKQWKLHKASLEINITRLQHMLDELKALETDLQTELDLEKLALRRASAELIPAEKRGILRGHQEGK